MRTKIAFFILLICSNIQLVSATLQDYSSTDSNGSISVAIGESSDLDYNVTYWKNRFETLQIDYDELKSNNFQLQSEYNILIMEIDGLKETEESYHALRERCIELADKYDKLVIEHRRLERAFAEQVEAEKPKFIPGFSIVTTLLALILYVFYQNNKSI